MLGCRRLTRRPGGARVFGIRLLGPVRAVRLSREIALGGPKKRAVLALLVLEAGRAVPTGLLMEERRRGSLPPAAAATGRPAAGAPPLAPTLREVGASARSGAPQATRLRRPGPGRSAGMALHLDPGGAARSGETCATGKPSISADAVHCSSGLPSGSSNPQTSKTRLEIL